MTSHILLYALIYFILGAFTGLMSGILGIGGGIIVVPGLVFVFHLSGAIPDHIIMHVASGTSLAVMIFTSQASFRAHYKIGEILWPIFHKMWPGIFLGTVVGAILARLMRTDYLQMFFSVFLLFVLFKMLFMRDKIEKHRFPNPWINRLSTAAIGLLSGLLGVGGGVLIVPYLGHFGLSMRHIVPISNLCTLTVALLGTLLFMIVGYQATLTTSYCFGYVYWPAVLGVAIPSMLVAPYGAKLNYILPVKQLKYGFMLMLFLTAMSMFWGVK